MKKAKLSISGSYKTFNCPYCGERLKVRRRKNPSTFVCSNCDKECKI